MGFINLGRLNIRKRNLCASALISLSDFQPPSVYKSHILNGPVNKFYISSGFRVVDMIVALQFFGCGFASRWPQPFFFNVTFFFFFIIIITVQIQHYFTVSAQILLLFLPLMMPRPPAPTAL